MSAAPEYTGSDALSLTESHLSIEATRPSFPRSISSASRVPRQFSSASSAVNKPKSLGDAKPIQTTGPGTISIDSQDTLIRSESHSQNEKAGVDGKNGHETASDSETTAAVELKAGEDLEKGKVGAVADEPVDEVLLTSDGQKITVVDWDGPDDPASPKNWTNNRRMGATLIVASFTLLSPMSSTMIAPASVQLAERFGTASTVEVSAFTSIFVLAYAVGPLFLGPASELYGRVPVLQIANLVYLLFNLVCAFATTSTHFLVFRFLAGLGGSAPLGIGAGVLGDVWRPEERGRAASLYSLGPLLGPAVGPIIGSWLAEKSRYEWVFWSTTILCAVIQLFGLVYLRETYAPQLLKNKAMKIKKERGLPASSELVQTIFQVKAKGSKKPIDVFKHAMIMPFKLFWVEHILQIFAVFMAFVYGLIYITTVTTTDIFTQIYGESLGISGLNYISQGLGFFIWAQAQGRLLDVVYRKLKLRYGGEGKPEYRLPMMFFAVIFLPFGLLLYGWGAQDRLHWIVPNIGLGLTAAGMIGAFQCINMYLIDAFTLHAASAVAAASCLRSICGFGFLLFAPSMFSALGYGWGCTLLALVSIAISWPSVPALFLYGEKIRASSKYAAKTKVDAAYK